MLDMKTLKVKVVSHFLLLDVILRTTGETVVPPLTCILAERVQRRLRWNDDNGEGRPGTPLQTASLRLRTIGKDSGPSSLGCLHPRRGRFNW